MELMRRFDGPRGLTICLGLVLLLEAGCSSPAGMQGSASPQPSPPSVPFHDRDQDATLKSDQVVPVAAQDSRSKPETELPFHDSESLPAGTLLTVRLKSPLNADPPGSSSSFEAVLDEPVVIEGDTVVPRGSAVAGRVQSTRVSEVKHNRGYVRLALDSINIAGHEVPVQTSSLLTRGKALQASISQSDAAANTITLEKGRRLTFRLTQPAYVGQRTLFTR
jgi:hypothetical protein